MTRAQAYSDIVFRCHGKLYVSGDLILVVTDEGRRPAIFVRPDFQDAFLMSTNDIGVMEIEPLTVKELQYWKRHCLEASDAEVLGQCVLEFGRAERQGKERWKVCEMWVGAGAEE